MRLSFNLGAALYTFVPELKAADGAYKNKVSRQNKDLNQTKPRITISGYARFLTIQKVMRYTYKRFIYSLLERLFMIFFSASPCSISYIGISL